MLLQYELFGSHAWRRAYGRCRSGVIYGAMPGNEKSILLHRGRVDDDIDSKCVRLDVYTMNDLFASDGKGDRFFTT